jgi:DNA ligase-1
VINYEYTDVYIAGYTKGDMKFLLNYLDGSPAGVMEFMPINERKHFHSIKKIISETEDIVKTEPISCRVKHRFKTKKKSYVSYV